MRNEIEETRIGSYYIYPNNTPFYCSYRVWIGVKPVCTKEVGAAIIVDEGRCIEAPKCSEYICKSVIIPMTRRKEKEEDESSYY